MARLQFSFIQSFLSKEFGRATDRITTTIANAGSFVEDEVNKNSGIRSFLEKVNDQTG